MRSQLPRPRLRDHSFLVIRGVSLNVPVIKQEARTMSTYPITEQLLSPENVYSPPDQRLQGDIAPMKSWSGNTGTSDGERGTADAIGDIVAARLSSLIDDCIQQVTSSKELLLPAVSEIKRSSDEISERLRQSRKQALLRKDELEAERQEVHQAACKVINVLNDTMEELKHI